MYKVFVNDHLLHFLNGSNPAAVPAGAAKVMINSPDDILKYATPDTLAEWPAELNFLCRQPEETFRTFASKYRLIEAAGGLVQNSHGHILFIFRRGFWDLPKGKMEQGESPEECALREVEEECGISKLKIDHFIGHTYHTYTHKQQQVLKQTWWYYMHCHGSDMIKVQTDEDIEEGRWVPPTDVPQYIDKCYGSIREVAASVKR